jgi:hypothetical protein
MPNMLVDARAIHMPAAASMKAYYLDKGCDASQAEGASGDPCLELAKQLHLALRL